MSSSKNKVLANSYQSSTNFFKSDLIFLHYFEKNISDAGKSYMSDKVNYVGEKAAGEMNKLSLDADKNGPQLVKRNVWGENIDEIDFHPSYWKLSEIAVKSEMFRIKWEPSLRSKFSAERNRLSFSSSYFFAMSECGLFCPLCMTDGAATLIDKFCSEKDKERLLQKIYTEDYFELKTGAMFLTEKAGGSDVGANLVDATKVEGKDYLLNGEKWFCSNANGDVIFALARTDSDREGTKGLSIFLVEKTDKNGDRNPWDIFRLKEKLGVRSMASAEIMLKDTKGKLIGEEFNGFKVMTEMINVSRLYNSIAALSASRRALVEAYQFLCHRITFGKKAIEHALVRDKLAELGALNAGNFYLTWRSIEALDLAENGDAASAQLLRFLTPMVKKWSAEKGVYITRESMELMGGMGYIEDNVVPKIMRDIMVLPIWEGAGNIMTLDMLRASFKSQGMQIMTKEIIDASLKSSAYQPQLTDELNSILGVVADLKDCSSDELETTAKYLFEKLTILYQMALLIENRDEISKDWIDISLRFFSEKITPNKNPIKTPESIENVHALIAWTP